MVLVSIKDESDEFLGRMPLDNGLFRQLAAEVGAVNAENPPGRTEVLDTLGPGFASPRRIAQPASMEFEPLAHGPILPRTRRPPQPIWARSVSCAFPDMRTAPGERASALPRQDWDIELP